MAVLIIVVTIAVAVAVLLGGLWFAADSAIRVRRFARSTDLVPGRAGRAPRAWASADEPAAVLHRRVRYAIATVHENPTLTATAGVTAALGRLDDEIFALDDRLIAAAGAGGGSKDAEALRHISFAVDYLETLPGRLVYVTSAEQETAIDQAIAFLRDPVEPPEPDGTDDDD